MHKIIFCRLTIFILSFIALLIQCALDYVVYRLSSILTLKSTCKPVYRDDLVKLLASSILLILFLSAFCFVGPPSTINVKTLWPLWRR